MKKRKATVSLDLVHIVLRHASNSGWDLSRVNHLMGGILDKRLEPGLRIPIQQLDPIWSEIIRQAGDPNFGLHLGEAADQQTSGGILFSVMMNCATVRSALEKQARYHALSTDLIQLRIQEQGEITRYIWEVVDGEVDLDRQYTDIVFCGLVLPLRRLTQNLVRPVEIHFKYSRPIDVSEQRRVFECPLQFDSPQNELIFRSKDLDQPVFMANPQVLGQLEEYAQARLSQRVPMETWSDRAAALIRLNLLGGESPALGAVARALALSPRQIQNKLRAEGVTFQALLDRVRKEAALAYLEDPRLTLCDVAFLLGFSEQSTFNHAFKRWLGITPGEYRRPGFMMENTRARD